MAASTERLRQLLVPAVTALGFEFWGVELLRKGRALTLRVYIDAEDGVSVDDCAAASRQVSAVLDVEDPISGEYVLEVSSPGMDRPLFDLAHYAAWAGADVRLSLRVAFDGRRRFAGRLLGVEGEDVVLHVDGEEYLLPFEQIERANVVPDLG